MTAISQDSLSLMLSCDACKKTYLHANIGFDKPNDFITCPYCSQTSFLHKSVGSNQEKYFEILGSNFSFEHAKKADVAAADLNIEGSPAVSEENMRLWINDTLSNKPETDVSVPEVALDQKSNTLTNMLDTMFKTLQVTLKDGSTQTFQSLNLLEAAVLEKKISSDDILNYKNEKASLSKHSKTRSFFIDAAKKQFLESLKSNKTELQTSTPGTSANKNGPYTDAAGNATPKSSAFAQIFTGIFAIAISLILAFLAYKNLP